MPKRCVILLLLHTNVLVLRADPSCLGTSLLVAHVCQHLSGRLQPGTRLGFVLNGYTQQQQQDVDHSRHLPLFCVLVNPQEETVTSLTYASRVKLITNNANKNSESEQMNRLKAIIKQLRAGKTDVDLEGVLD